MHLQLFQLYQGTQSRARYGSCKRVVAEVSVEHENQTSPVIEHSESTNTTLGL